MTGHDFTAWMRRMGWSVARTSRGLGIARNTVTKYMVEGAPDYIGYACAAIAFGLPPWSKNGPTSASSDHGV